ncbi:MAG: hypothetical protein C0501_17650 [Isosphaera sp.]|nr:hypothetical protein [Isosphaera sp.]
MRPVLRPHPRGRAGAGRGAGGSAGRRAARLGDVLAGRDRGHRRRAARAGRDLGPRRAEPFGPTGRRPGPRHRGRGRRGSASRPRPGRSAALGRVVGTQPAVGPRPVGGSGPVGGAARARARDAGFGGVPRRNPRRRRARPGRPDRPGVVGGDRRAGRAARGRVGRGRVQPGRVAAVRRRRAGRAGLRHRRTEAGGARDGPRGVRAGAPEGRVGPAPGGRPCRGGGVRRRRRPGVRVRPGGAGPAGGARVAPRGGDRPGRVGGRGAAVHRRGRRVRPGVAGPPAAGGRVTPAFKHPDVPASPVARWDARWKLAALAGAAFGAAALTRLGPSAAALGLAAALLLASRLPGRWVRGRLALLAFAALPFPLVLPFTLGGPGFDLGPVRVSERGLEVGAAVFARCLAVGCLGLVLLGTAPPHHTLAAARRLRVPGVLVLLAGLAYRYAFLLGAELRRVRVALRTRGFRMSAGRHGYRTLGHVVGAVLVRGADRADRVAEAMRCRGFDGAFRTTAGFRTAAADVLGFAAALAATIALVTWDRLGPS